MTKEIQNQDTTVTPFLIWKHVPGYVNIQANQYGQIRDSGTHELKTFYEQSGYFSLLVRPVGGEKKTHQYVHALVMLAFKGERPTGYHVDHKNGDKLDNTLSNLHYVTRSQNMRNRKDQITVMYNGEDTILIEALEDLFGKDCVSTTRYDARSKLYNRIKENIRNGRTFEQAVQYEITKNGWPVPQEQVAA